MARKLVQAIYLYREDDELCVANHSSIGDCLRRDGVQSVYAFLTSQNGKATVRVERGCGAARHSLSLVTDRAALEAAALAQGIDVRIASSART